jgi:hypothetical protein
VEIVGGRTVDVYVIGMFPYGNEWMIRASTPPELVWDAATKTITFPKTRFFGSYGFQTMRWGIGGYDTETGALATMFSEFYTEVVLGI